MADTLQTAIQHHQAGRLAEAERLYRQVLGREPRNNHALYLLALAARQRGQNSASLDLTRRAIEIDPGIGEYHLQLGLLLMAEGEFPSAAGAFRTTLKLRSALVEAEAHLGNSLYMMRDLDGAIAAFNRFLSARPNSPEILNNLGTTLREAHRPEDAIAAYRKALAHRADLVDVWQNLGHTLRQVGKPDEAAGAYRKVIDLKADSAQAQYDLAAALKEAGDLDGAIDAARAALRLRPGWAEALALLGGLAHATTQFDEVLTCHQQLLGNGKDPRLAASLLHALYFNPQFRAARIYAEHARWNELYARSFAPAEQVSRTRRGSNRRLRIGYVSADFRLHASSLFTLPLLSNHDRSAFEVFCYAGVDKPDELTAAHRARCDVWRDVTKLSDEQMAEMVRSDQVDILIDLSLHSAGNRMLVFARKPAPVQLTWLAYPGTSGLETMDFRISDPYLDPPSASSGKVTGLDERSYSEKTLRLADCFWCYDPLEEEPAVSKLPALVSGFVTFGSLNSFAKVTSETIEVWASVLHAVVGSRMIVLAPTGKSRQRFLNAMKSHGVDPARIEFASSQARTPYLASFHRIDICLDTWPYAGGTTTCDSLWMGVPVLTRPGPTAMSRSGVSILSNLGHPEWISHSSQELVASAQVLARGLSVLAVLRRGLREQMRRSPLMDAGKFARSMESAYRTAWERSASPGTFS
jgi:predicted O-linked N-acetylglucosamine transferase (SPINDLY family)